MLQLYFSTALKGLLFAILLVIEVDLYSQAFSETKNNDFINSDYYSNYSRNTPSKAALGSFGNIPINYVTGRPEINLNLCTLPSRELTIPISLNYDASGLKVDDISGQVGLKWNLNAGGYVVRQLNGLPDEDPNVGYWKYKNELNAETIDASKWVEWAEKNNADTAPDEFVLYVPGRTISFIIKDGVPVPVTRQNVRMAYTMANNRINGFFLTAEDGTYYEFGLLDNAIEERRVETLHMVANFAFDWNDDRYNCYVDGHETTKQYDWFYVGNNPIVYEADLRETIDAEYNSRWFLTTMKSPGGDYITFKYIKSGATSYATQPVVTRKTPLLTEITNYTYEQDICYRYVSHPYGHCTDSRHHVIVRTDKQTKAYAAFNAGCPDYNYTCSNNYPLIVQQGQPNHFDPKAYRIDPEGIFVNQSLITESLIRLDNITSATGNKVTFHPSSRVDLPNAIKYDRIVLTNIKNEIIKNFQLKYGVVGAQTQKDYMWLSEYFLASNIAGPLTTFDLPEMGGEHWAPRGVAHLTTNALLRKYVAEGLKDYNYNRLYLDAVAELSPLNTEHPLYSFVYENRTVLKRRLTPLQTISGDSRSVQLVEEEYLPVASTYGNNGKAMVLQAYDPSSFRLDNYGTPGIGDLTQIKYPTGGYTKFSGVSQLSKISDYDVNGEIVAERVIKYVSGAGAKNPILESFQNSRDPVTGLFKRFKILSSAPQNRTYRPYYGINTKVVIYNGPSTTEHNGYEERTYSFENEVVNPVYSIPKDIDASGNLLTNLPRWDVFPFTKSDEKDHLSGLPLETTIYDKHGRKIRSTTNSYLINPYGYQAQVLKGFVGGSFPYNDDKKRRYGRFSVAAADWIVLEKTVDKIFDQSAGYDPTKFIATETSYTYNQATNQITSKVISTAGNTITTKYKYANNSDYSFTDVPPKNCRDDFDPDCIPSEGVYASENVKAIRLLRSSNQNSTVVEEQTLLTADGNTKLTSVAYKTFKVIEGVAKPSGIFLLKAPVDASSYKPVKVSPAGVLVHDINNLRRIHVFDEYDVATKNLLKQTTLNGTSVKYLWDAVYANAVVKSQITNEGINEQRITYEQKPLVGVTSLQDANGIMSRFEYDHLGRLKLTKDGENNILHRYRYHSVNDNVNESLTASMTVTGGLALGSTVTFTVPIETRPSGVTSLSFDFGDGTSMTTTSSSVNKIYAAAGSYVVKVTKSNPEYGSAEAQKTVVIKSPLNVSVCADGPVRGDVCRIITTADAYGSCTAAPNRYWTYVTKLKAAITGNCTSAMTYSWEYKTSSSETWVKFGTTQEVTSPFRPPSVVTGDVRCIATDACGVSGTSSLINFSFFKSNMSCTAQ